MKRFDITEYTVRTDKIPDDCPGFKFILISDLHANEYGINLHEAAGVINREKPDGVLLAGDIVSRNFGGRAVNTANFICSMAKHYKVYYAPGNHESTLKVSDVYDEMYSSYRELLKEEGVVFLEDETTGFYKGDFRINITGVEIDSVFYRGNHPVMGPGLLDKHLGICDDRYFNILLAHNPDYFDNYARWGADLTLSGHLHGGIVRINKLGGIIGTDYKILPEYDGGIYTRHNRKMIVSRGLGTHTVNVRINNRPEMVIVKILAKNRQKS
ncbi:MAG: metallophosphoesterase [Butyrivibrio sp.]